MTNVFSSNVFAEYLNSDAKITSVGIPERDSMRYLPVRDAWYDVPQATKQIRDKSPISSIIFCILSLCVKVFLTAVDCSLISFIMKWSYPSFSAISGVHSILSMSFLIRLSNSSWIITSSFFKTTISPFSGYNISFAYFKIAGESDAK